MLRGSSFQDSRAYVIYTALDEIRKCAFYLMRILDLLDGSPISPNGDYINRLSFTQIIEDLDARERRLLEVLITLVLYETTNSQEYFRDLLLFEDLDDLLSFNKDFEDFYGPGNLNTDYLITHPLADIRRIESTIDFSKTWYRLQSTCLPKQNQLIPGRLLSSGRSRIKKALPIMVAHEKLLVAFSYVAGFGEASESIDYSINFKNYNFNQGQEQTKSSKLCILALAILNRCNSLLGCLDIPILKRITDLLQQTDPANLVYSATIGDIKKGDFVLVHGYLAEVTEFRDSDFGYRSYHIRYIDERPIQEILEDWFPAFHIQLFYTREKLFTRLHALEANGILPIDTVEKMKLMADVELQSALRASYRRYLEAWSPGRGSTSTSKKKVKGLGDGA